MNFSQLKQKLFQKSIRKLVENFFSLSVLQISNYLIPLVTLPYLTYVLGPERFGLTAFAQAITQYFIMFTDFGFNLSATKAISINRDDKEKVSQIFLAVYLIRAVLLLISIAALWIMITWFTQFRDEKVLYLYSFISVVGYVLFPQWFYQGIERMKFIAIFTLTSRIIFAGLIFVFIKGTTDYLWLPLLYSFGSLASGIVAFGYSFVLYDLKIVFPTSEEIKQQFITGWHIFISSLSVNLYTTSNSVFLGLLTNNITVGYYSAAERIFRACQYLGMPLFQALFPHFSKLIVDDKERAVRQFTKLFRIVMIVTFLISLALSLSSHFVISIILGAKYFQSILILQILSWVIFASWGNYCLGIQGLVNFGFEQTFSKIVLIFGALHIVLIYFGVRSFGVLAVPVIWFLTESLIFSTEYVIVKRRKILL